MSALDFTARALALRAMAHNPLVFSELAQARLPASVTRIESAGHAAPGVGSGVYVADGAADAAMMTEHSAAVFAGEEGRFFRLLGDEGGFVTPEQLGCPPSGSGINQQPFIQAAIDYAMAVGLRGVRFTQASYELWTPWRDPEVTGITPNESLTGFPLLIRKKTELVSAPGGTTLHRRKPDGGDPSVLEGTQWLPLTTYPGNPGGRYWRGGMFVLVGQDPRPDDYDELAGLVLRGKWKLSGGLPRSATPGGYQGGETGYFDLRPDGSGWDMSDKPIWFHNDMHTGDLEFDELWIDGFRGELVYQGGETHGSIIGHKLRCSNTDADGFNPGPRWAFDGNARIEIGHLTIERTFQALEGGAGTGRSWIGVLDLRDNVLNSGLIGSQWNFAPDSVDPPPSLNIDLVRTQRCGNLRLYMFNRIGRIEAIDTPIQIGQANLSAVGIEIGEIATTLDAVTINTAVSISGPGGAGALTTRDVRIGRIHCSRTGAARAAGHIFVYPCRWSGSLDNHVFVGEVSGETTAVPQQSTTTHDFNVGFGGVSGLRLNMSSNSFNAETNPILSGGRPFYLLATTTTSGNFPVTLPDPANYPAGSCIALRHRANANVVFSVQTAGTRINRRMLLPANTTVEFVCEGGPTHQWRPLTQGPSLVGTSGSVDLRKAGSAIPAGDVSDEATFTLNGAKTGMTVTVTPTTAIGEDALLVGRVTADGTVGIRARNMNLGGALAIGSIAYSVTLQWPN